MLHVRRISMCETCCEGWVSDTDLLNGRHHHVLHRLLQGHNDLDVLWSISIRLMTIHYIYTHTHHLYQNAAQCMTNKVKMACCCCSLQYYWIILTNCTVCGSNLKAFRGFALEENMYNSRAMSKLQNGGPPKILTLVSDL